jgi:hypothetical protein
MILITLYDQRKYNYCEKWYSIVVFQLGIYTQERLLSQSQGSDLSQSRITNRSPHNRATNTAIIFTTRTSGYSCLQRPIPVGYSSLYRSILQALNESVQIEHINASMTSFYTFLTGNLY